MRTAEAGDGSSDEDWEAGDGSSDEDWEVVRATEEELDYWMSLRSSPPKWDPTKEDVGRRAVQCGSPFSTTEDWDAEMAESSGTAARQARTKRI